MGSPALSNKGHQEAEKYGLPKGITCDMFKRKDTDSHKDVNKIQNKTNENFSNIISLNPNEVKANDNFTPEEIKQIDFLMEEYVYEIDDLLEKGVKIKDIMKYRYFCGSYEKITKQYPNLEKELEWIFIKYRHDFLKEKIIDNILKPLKGFNKHLKNYINELIEISPGYDINKLCDGLSGDELKIFNYHFKVVSLEFKIRDNIKNRNESHNEELEKYVYELIHIDHGIHLQNLLTSLTIQEKNYIKSYL